jgi:hypothetical protein
MPGVVLDHGELFAHGERAVVIRARTAFFGRLPPAHHDPIAGRADRRFLHAPEAQAVSAGTRSISMGLVLIWNQLVPAPHVKMLIFGSVFSSVRK